MSRATILVVEDDADIRELVRTLVERAGMDVVEATDGREGLRMFYEHRPDLVLLDVAMPELNGWDALKRIREVTDTPVVMVTASGQELEKVRGLREGADDYITKPFGQQELLARVEAVLRRSRDRGDGADVHADGLVEIDFPQRRVTIDGTEVAVTPTEFKLLAVFVRHPRQVLSQEQLLEMVWGDPASHSGDQVKLYVSYLRRKLREAADIDPLETVRGFGYRYDPAHRG